MVAITFTSNKEILLFQFETESDTAAGKTQNFGHFQTSE